MHGQRRSSVCRWPGMRAAGGGARRQPSYILVPRLWSERMQQQVTAESPSILYKHPTCSDLPPTLYTAPVSRVSTERLQASTLPQPNPTSLISLTQPWATSSMQHPAPFNPAVSPCSAADLRPVCELVLPCCLQLQASRVAHECQGGGGTILLQAVSGGGHWL